MPEFPAYFTEQDGQFIPSMQTTGPWNPDFMGGVPVSLLLMQELCAIPSAVPMVTTRATIDLLRPLRRVPLTIRREILHDGKQVQMVRTVMVANGKDIATCSAQRLRIIDNLGDRPAPGLPYPGPEEVKREGARVGIHAIERRFVKGNWGEKHAVLWARLRCEIVAGRKSDPLAAAIAFSDFGGGLTSLYPIEDWNFPNSDLSLHLVRAPKGEWILIDAETESGNNGIAMAHMILADQNGIIGRAHQTLMVSRKQKAP